jgi:hypothetical protein
MKLTKVKEDFGVIYFFATKSQRLKATQSDLRVASRL